MEDEPKFERVYTMVDIITALEYGVILTESARGLGKEVTKELVEKLEKVVQGEFPIKTSEQLNTNMMLNVMAALEPPVDQVELAKVNERNAMAKGTKKGGMKGGKGGKKGC